MKRVHTSGLFGSRLCQAGQQSRYVEQQGFQKLGQDDQRHVEMVPVENHIVQACDLNGTRDALQQSAEQDNVHLHMQTTEQSQGIHLLMFIK